MVDPTRALAAGSSHRVIAAFVGVLLLLFAAGPVGAQLADTAWPMVHHDIRHTGQSEYNGPSDPNVKWTVDRLFRRSSPTLGTDGTVYIGTERSLCAYAPEDGSERWCYQLAGTIRRNNATLDVNGHLYIGARDNRLYALDSTDEGQEVWSYKIQNDGDVNTSPVISPTDGTVYVVATFNGWAHALSPTAGPPPIWSLPNGGFVAYSSPALGADGTIYFGTSRGYLRALTPAGTLRWEVKVGKYIRDTSPVIATDGTIYIGSADGIAAVAPDGTIKWTFVTNGRVRSTPALDPAGRIYVGSVGQGPSLRATFYAINPNGTERWSYVPTAVQSRFFSSPAIGADGTIYTTSGSRVIALDSQDGSLVWEYETGKRGSIISSPAIGSDGTLYIGADKLYAFGQDE